ncbi:MAG: hypothetical protein EAX86_04110 [Candidatus Heimdallarchaeota archaeon]|nr:hypothetical protein [Candidatus Heimdallarchaeota archaeon]
MNIKDVTINYLKKNEKNSILIAVTYLILIAITLIKPKGFPITNLMNTYGQFAVAVTAFILLLLIGGFLLYRYFSKTKPLKGKPDYLIIWGISFLIFSLLYLGLSLEALGFISFNTSDPLSYIFWYSPIIIWLACFWVGLGKIKRFESNLVYIPALLILVLGEIGFIISLLILEDIFGMYGFFFLIVIPIVLIYALYWYNLGKNSDLSSPFIIALGFIILAISFSGWVFWYFSDVMYIHYIWTNMMNISFALIFAGFLRLPKELLTMF